MKTKRLRIILLPLAAIAMVCLNGCCCPCSSNAKLMEDFLVSPEEQVEWLQHQRALRTMSDDVYEDDAIDFRYDTEK